MKGNALTGGKGRGLIKKMLLAVTVAAAVLLALTVGTARADPAFHTRFSFPGEMDFPAGTLCDFNSNETFTVVVDFTAAPNGASTTVLTESITHNNLDTGYSLSEVDHFTIESPPGSSTVIQAGIFWHLQDANDHNVLVRAGEVTFDASTGQLISFTPNSAGDQTFAQVVCPALGGSPA
jgi:hypothetical protein